jgi:predicted RNA-binding Zn ribbon-like protein
MLSPVSPAYDIPKAAPPGPLRLVQQFVNSVDLEHGTEWLNEGWFAEHGLPGDENLTRAREAREALRALLNENNGARPTPSAVETLNRISAGAALAVRFDENGLPRLQPLDGRPLAGIFAAAYTAMVDGSWSRLKTCRNCCWAFYDYSKNRSATWCSMRLCGNRLKTRAYRSRHRA